MSKVYKIGSMSFDDVPTGIRMATGTSAAARTKMVNQAGADFIVTAGKTFYVTSINFTVACVATYAFGVGLAYDDNGAGAAQVIYFPLMFSTPSSPLMAVNFNLNVYFAIPAGKYLTLIGTGANVAAVPIPVIISGYEE